MSKLLFRSAIFLFLGALLGACASDASSTNSTDADKVLAENTSEAQGLETEENIPPVSTTVDSVALRAVADSLAQLAEAEAAVKAEAAAKKEKAKKKEAKKPRKRSAISFTQKSHNYGVIMEGDKVEHTFKFKNTGKADLLITNVKASCGCTQPSYPFIPIAPGEEGKIDVVFDSKGKLGRQKNLITVVTNARPSTYQIYMEGTVDTERDSKPSAPEENESNKK